MLVSFVLPAFWQYALIAPTHGAHAPCSMPPLSQHRIPTALAPSIHPSILLILLILPAHAHSDHYPPKELPGPGEGFELQTGGVPFTARTEYMDEFFGKPRMPRPVEPLVYKANPMPWMTVGGGAIAWCACAHQWVPGWLNIPHPVEDWGEGRFSSCPW